MYCMPFSIIMYYAGTCTCIPCVQQQQKETADLQYFAMINMLLVLVSADKTSSEGKNYTNVIQFGWVVLILWLFLQTWSFSNFVKLSQFKSGEIYPSWLSIPSFRISSTDVFYDKEQSTVTVLVTRPWFS